MPKKSRKSAPPGFLTAAAAMKMIGVQRSTFYNMVANGSIKKMVPPGHTEGYYLEWDVREFARRYTSFMHRDTRFELALPEDIEPIRALVAREGGGYHHAIPAEVMRAWMRRNNRAIYVLRKDDVIVGYVSLFPLTHDALYKRMTGEYWNRSIPLEDIQSLQPNSVTDHLYVAEMIVDQSLPEHAHLAARLVRGVRALLLKWSTEDHVSIREIYAVATTPFGVNICRKLHMEPLDLPSGVRPEENRIPFKMDVASSRLFRKGK